MTWSSSCREENLRLLNTSDKLIGRRVKRRHAGMRLLARLMYHHLLNKIDIIYDFKNSRSVWE